MMRPLAVILLLFSSGSTDNFFHRLNQDTSQRTGVLGDLECWKGICPEKFGTNVTCPDDANPSLSKEQCSDQDKKCFKVTGYFGSEPAWAFGCLSEKDVLKQGYDFENGCSDVTDKIKEVNKKEELRDFELCFCDTPLCNTATKKTVAATIVLFFL